MRGGVLEVGYISTYLVLLFFYSKRLCRFSLRVEMGDGGLGEDSLS